MLARRSGSGKGARKTTKARGRSATTGRYVQSGRSRSGAARTTAKQSSGGTPRARPEEERPQLHLVGSDERLERLITELGNNRVAKLLAVSASQPSRWRAGKEGIGAENQRKLIDLDYVFGRLEQLFPIRQAEIWLTSFNAHLGAVPIDVLRLRGALPVIDAIDAEAQGAFA